jgi:hypothetical protein
MIDEDAIREDRLRRMASRQGLVLAKSRRNGSYLLDRGDYILFADPNRAVAVFGIADSQSGPLEISGPGYEASLNEIETYLTRAEKAEHTPPRGATK